MLPLPVLLLKSANAPLAMLPAPIVLFKSAPAPVAVLLLPLPLAKSVPAPTAVLALPVLSLSSENTPIAELYVPLLRLRRALWLLQCSRQDSRRLAADLPPACFGRVQGRRVQMSLELVECLFSYPASFRKISAACRGNSRQASAARNLHATRLPLQSNHGGSVVEHNEQPLERTLTKCR